MTDTRFLVDPVDESRPEADGLNVGGFDREKACVTLPGRAPEFGASVWARRAERSRTTTRAYCGPHNLLRHDACPGLIRSDVRLAARGDDATATALWNISTI